MSGSSVAGQLFEVEEILNKRGSGDNREFLVQWAGYPIEESTWEPLSNFDMSPERNRSTSRGRKTAKSPAKKKSASKSPGRPKKLLTMISKSVSKSPTRKTKAKSPKRKASKSPSRRRNSPKKVSTASSSSSRRQASKSPSISAKSTPIKPKSAQKSTNLSRSRSRSRGERLFTSTSKLASKVLTPSLTSNLNRVFEPIQKSISLSKYQSPLSRESLPLSRDTYSPRRPYATDPSALNRLTYRPVYNEMVLRQRATPDNTGSGSSSSSSSNSNIGKSLVPVKSSVASYERKLRQLLPRKAKVNEYKRRAVNHFRYYARFYAVLFMLALIALVLHHNGYQFNKSMKQMQKELNAYISSLKKQQ